MSPNKNIFVVLEGIDHSGKSTIARELHRILDAELIAFPDRTTKIGNKINAFLKNSENYSNMNSVEYNKKVDELFRENRYEKVEYIKNTLKTKSIVCDRYWISGVVYSAAKGLDYGECREKELNLPQPDLTFFLDVSPKEARKRVEYGDEVHDIPELQNKIYEIYKRNDEKMINIKMDNVDNMVRDILDHIDEFNKYLI